MTKKATSEAETKINPTKAKATPAEEDTTKIEVVKATILAAPTTRVIVAEEILGEEAKATDQVVFPRKRVFLLHQQDLVKHALWYRTTSN